jgi:hypothetical protein
MPIRSTRPRKADGLKHHIEKLYQDPSLKYFADGEDWGPICDLIYGPHGLHTAKFFDPDVRQRGLARLAALRKLWLELRDDILAAQARYQPKQKPWGARFDARKKR